MKSDFSGYRAVVFDMDDTLFPEHAFVRSGFAAVDRHLESTAGIPDFFPKAWRRFESGERGAIFDAVLTDCGHPADRDSVKALVSVYRSHRPDIVPDDWVAPLFSALRASGRLIGVITDGPVIMQREKVLALGLPAVTDAVVSSDELGGEATRKPSRLPFDTLASRLGVGPADCVYIGDNPAKDFIGARNAGWASIRLRIPGRLHSDAEPRPGAGPDAEVATGEALTALILPPV